MPESSSDANPLDALAEEFIARHRRGERPSLDEFIARRPDLADDIRDLFPGLAVMEGVRPDRGDVTGPFEAGPAAPMLKRLGDYRILREVGRGGMGVVYEAEQESLGRHVALKVLPAHSLLEPQRLRRFHREAKAAARLHHTNIVPVYGVGACDGLHYYVMQFIQGQGLDQVLAELRKLRPAPPVEEPAPASSRGTVSAVSAAQSLLTGRFESAPPTEAEPSSGSGGSSSVRLPGQAEGTPPSRTGREYWRSVARVGVQVADALAYAHREGVLHRDVKPSNLLLDGRGNVWVTDFGLAKAADGEDLTHTGDIVGTVRYMAPECFTGKADARSDVYSLGLTLYELLTLRPAFVARDRNQLLQQVLHGEPPRPRAVSRDVPRDLETVVLKAVARDPGHRYQNPAELADDLRRFVDDRPVKARRVGVVEQLWRWRRRNPVVAGLTAALLLLLLVGTAGSGVAAYYFSRLAGAEAKARADADKANKDIVARDQEIQQQANQLSDDFDRLNRANALMEGGRLHADAGENDEALADYTEAVDERPDMSVVWFTRGQFYLQFFCWDEAAADFARGFELQAPADPNLWLDHAWLRLYVGDQAGYRRACAAMLDKFGQTTDPATMNDIAQACTAGPDALDDYGRLIQLIEKPATDGSNVQVFGPLCLAHYRAGRPEQVPHLNEVAVQKGIAAWSGPGLALVYHRLGQDGEAKRQMADDNAALDGQLNNLSQVAVTQIPQNYIVGYDLGGYLLHQEMIRQLKGLGAFEHPVSWIGRGRGRAALGQWEAAAADVARAIALRPDDPQLRLEHSRMLAAQERWQEAAADYDEVLRKHSDDGNLWLERGRLYAKQSRWEQAAADFNHALELPNFSTYVDIPGQPAPVEMLDPDAAFEALVRLRPRDAHLWLQRAGVLDGKGGEAEAVAAYAKALECRPDDAYVIEQRGAFFGQHEHWAEAAADFSKALDLLPSSPEYGYLEATILNFLQQWPAALEAEVALRPTDGRLCMVRARRRDFDGEWDLALADYGRALKLRPHDADLRLERGNLLGKWGRWKEAAADFDGVPDEQYFNSDWLADACLHVLNGDHDGYRDICARAAKRFGATRDVSEAGLAALIASLAPDSGVDAAEAVRLQVRAVGANAQMPAMHALGLAHYRAGHFDAAARWYRDAMKLQTNDAALEPLNWLGLALANDRLKQPDEARRCLDKATAWVQDANKALPAALADRMPTTMPVNDWLEYQILRQEAEAALKEAAPKLEKQTPADATNR